MSRFLLALVLLSSSAHAAVRLQVPRVATTPRIDGAVNAKEWKGAVRVRVGDGAHALLQHNGQFLFVALVGRNPGVASLCTQRGKDVRILHASGALGTAIYEPVEKKWSMKQGFTFTNRDTGDSAEAMAERKKFLTSDGWFANTLEQMVPQREFQIRTEGRREIPLVLGFLGFQTVQVAKMHYWPDTLTDDCGSAELAGGFTETEYSFDPSHWGIAVLE